MRTKKQRRAEQTRERMLAAIKTPKVTIPTPVRRKLTQKEILEALHREIDAAADAGLNHYGVELYGSSEEEMDIITQKILPQLEKEGYRVTEYQGPVTDFGDTFGPDYTVSW